MQAPLSLGGSHGIAFYANRGSARVALSSAASLGHRVCVSNRAVPWEGRRIAHFVQNVISGS